MNLNGAVLAPQGDILKVNRIRKLEEVVREKRQVRSETPDREVVRRRQPNMNIEKKLALMAWVPPMGREDAQAPLALPRVRAAHRRIVERVRDAVFDLDLDDSVLRVRVCVPTDVKGAGSIRAFGDERELLR